jgi:hypothetical protein
MLAAKIWRLLPPGCEGGKALEKFLQYRGNQDLLRWETGLPFNSKPDECRRIVLKLAPRGLDAEVAIVERMTKYRSDRKA